MILGRVQSEAFQKYDSVAIAKSKAPVAYSVESEAVLRLDDIAKVKALAFYDDNWALTLTNTADTNSGEVLDHALLAALGRTDSHW